MIRLLSALLFKRTALALFILMIVSSQCLLAQAIYQPYSYQFYQKLNKELYSLQTSEHTAVKPIIINDSSVLRHGYDSLINRGLHLTYKAWAFRKLFNEHLIDIKNKEYTFYLDFLPDLQIGRDYSNKKTIGLNTRGFQVGGTIGSKFFFYTSGFENQGVFPKYLNDYINKTGIIPGQAFDFTGGANSKNWTYATSLFGYMPLKWISIETGIDKTFIGDGYRSMLLSDYAQNYPLLRLRINIGKKIQYMAMWAYMQDQSAVKFPGDHSPNRVKWAAFHYIDWSISNRASLGFFNALIIPDAYDNGLRHGFDLNYINPVLFIKSLSPSGPIPNHALVGFNGKYKLLSKTIAYAQVLFDQSTSTAYTKTGLQLGIRGADLLKVSRLNYLVEYNTAKPYTYSNQYPLVNYTQLNEPLAHPFGANFREILGILNYSIGKFDFQGQLNYAKYGLNTNNLNYGKDILLSHNSSEGNVIGQGLSTNFRYADAKVSYLINPKFNLRLEAGAVLRQEKNMLSSNDTKLITVGLRSTFRSIYTDF